MKERTCKTTLGEIHYWRNNMDYWRERKDTETSALVFLPGLTADHRLFAGQFEAFEKEYPCFVWDAPAHSASRPFPMEFTLQQEAKWLHSLLKMEDLHHPIFIGQSMGGLLAQCFMQQFPEEVTGFIAIDSMPLQKKYFSPWIRFILRHTWLLFALYPWKKLREVAAHSCTETESGYQLMLEMTESYKRWEYCCLVSRSYKMLSRAITKCKKNPVTCPALLLCGEKDKITPVRDYCAAWSRDTKLPLRIISGAGHNANVDKPEAVNDILREFLSQFAVCKEGYHE